LAFNNRAAGFYANHHPNSCYFYNNTGYGNNPNFNMLGMSAAGADTTVGVYRNNISFTGSLYSNRNGADEKFNSWTVSGITVSAADFQSVATMGLDEPRQADGSLPNLPNFHLAASSDLIDKGTDVGLPFAGTAPDLGCFETGLATGGSSSSGGASSGGSGGSPTAGSAGRAGSGGASGGINGVSGTTGIGGSSPEDGGTASSIAGSTSTGGSGLVTGGSGSSNTAGGSVSSAGTSSAPASNSGDPGGCSCSTLPRQGGNRAAAALFLLAAVMRTRRTRRT
jgi:hypothetical protein